MKRVPFGRTGEMVSEFCLGTMMFGARCDEMESDRILSAALERGVNFVDTAAMYVNGGTEEILRNMIGERVLGLAPEPRLDKGIPFSELRAKEKEAVA